MVKKWSLVWLLVLITAFSLVACSGSDETSSDSDSTSTDDSSSDSSGDEVVTLNFVHWINEDNGKWEPVIEKYEAENPGVKIESMPLVDNMNSLDYFKQLDLLASAGEDMDVIMFSNVNDLVKRIDAGLLSPIDSFMEEEGININEVYNNSYGPVDGKYYGLPMKNVSNLVMLNKAHLDEAGLEIPTDWTWADYREYAEKMTTDEHYGSYFHIWHNFQSSVKLLGNAEGSTVILNEDGTSNADNPLLRESLELRYQLEQEDQSSVPYAEILSQKLDYRQQFFTGEASMIPIASFMITEWGSFSPDFEIAWAPWPKNEPDNEVYTVMGGDLIGIAESSEHKQEAYDFMRWLTTEGISEQGIWVPSWKEAELSSILETLASGTTNPEAIHMESLQHTLEVSNPTKTFAPESYITEVLTEFDAEVEMYLLDEQDIDTTMENIENRAQAVIDANQ
ncbi:extracellular solute-binding protein [Aquibacillus halophilus]|uniref:Extracellular solute-binding protein n=1 Tax=Aquibacillus halophilus TaxID=930132 RepID=A0A6A8DJS0_9BACI|nr:extracellular solute-binding protein [Aquibacillus halophilus]MRH43227.1 extracellular solute-binding protein [Aquibacillus halophilus]